VRNQILPPTSFLPLQGGGLAGHGGSSTHKSSTQV